RGMSSDVVDRNLDAVRRWLGGFASGPGSSTRVREFFDADADYYPVRKFPEAMPRHGVADIEEFFEEFWEAWKSWHVDVLETSPVGDDRVLTRLRVSASGYTSGMSLDGDLFICFWLRNGRFLRMEDHMTARGARDALGLEDP